MRDLKDQVAWITGAGTGIGEAAALELANAGMNVALSGRREEPLKDVASRIEDAGRRALVLPLDVSDIDAISEAVRSIETEFSRLDVLVTSAGLNIPDRDWSSVSADGWKQVIDIDLNGAFYCCRAVLPKMRERGEGLIVNVSSWAGWDVVRLPGPAYTAAKHGLTAMTETINMEEGVNGIRACALCPGEVATPILDKRPVPVSEEDKAKMVQPEDCGEIIRFLAQLPGHVCVNELVVSPTWNRLYIGR